MTLHQSSPKANVLAGSNSMCRHAQESFQYPAVFGSRRQHQGKFPPQPGQVIFRISALAASAL